MPNDVTGEWILTQNIEPFLLGTMNLQQQNSIISGTVEWDNGPTDSILGVMIDPIVSFSVIRAGNLVGHYATEFGAALLMSSGVCVSNTGNLGSWQATKPNQS